MATDSYNWSCGFPHFPKISPLPLQKWICTSCAHFYGILRQKMTLNDDGSTQYLAKVCPRAKPLVFDPLPPITAALKHERPKKV